MRYYLTTTVKEVGAGSLCVYIPHTWNIRVGEEVDATARNANDEGENAPVFTYIATVRAANSGNGRKVTIPKFFGFKAGDWVTISLGILSNDS